MSQKTIKILVPLVFLSVFLFGLWIVWGKENEFISGEHYTKGDYFGTSLFVTFLKEGYALEKRSELDPESKIFTIPYEEDVRCYLTRDGKIMKRIESLDNFSNYAYIDSEKKAIEFVRLSTSINTYYLFRPYVMVEVFKRNIFKLKKNWTYGETSPSFFKKHNLSELKVTKRKEYYEITRYLIAYPWPGAKEYPSKPQLFKVIEKVFTNGQYTIEKNLILNNVNYLDILCPRPPL